MDKCPHCGRSDPNFLQIIEAMSNTNWGTGIDHRDAVSLLETTRLSISDLERKLKDLTRRKDEEIVWQSEDGKSRMTVGDDRKTYLRDINLFQKRIKAIEKSVSGGYQVAEVTIEQHNEAAFAILESMKKSGSIIVIDSEQG